MHGYKHYYYQAESSTNKSSVCESDGQCKYSDTKVTLYYVRYCFKFSRKKCIYNVNQIISRATYEIVKLGSFAFSSELLNET